MSSSMLSKAKSFLLCRISELDKIHIHLLSRAPAFDSQGTLHMRIRSSAPLCMVLCASLNPATLADATPVRSSIHTQAQIELTNTSANEEVNASDTQADVLEDLGVLSRAVINNSDGLYTAITTGGAHFVDGNRGSVGITASYSGTPGTGDILADRFGHVLNGTFEYDFTADEVGMLNLSGVIRNSGLSSISYFGFVQVFQEDEIGNGFNDAFFQFQLFDFNFDTEAFDLMIPLEAESGSYRIQLRLGHIGLGVLNVPQSDGSLEASWMIMTGNPCPADLTGDGTLNIFDISAFLIAFTARDPAADFAQDGVFNFLDVSSFLIEIGNGCP